MCYYCVWIREEWTKCPEKLQSIFWNVWNRLMQPCQVLQQFLFHFKHNFVSFNNFWFLYNVTCIKECQVFPKKISKFLKTIWPLKSAFLCSSLLFKQTVNWSRFRTESLGSYHMGDLNLRKSVNFLRLVLM